MAVVLIVAFDAQVTRLIQLYIVGVFVSFNLSQLGMIRHWTRHLRTETDPAERRRMMRSRLDQRLRARDDRGRCWSSCWSPSSSHGAWIAILAMGTLLHDHEEHPPPLRPRSARSWRSRTRRPGAADRGCTRSCWSPSCTSRRCGRWPTPRPAGPTCSRRVMVATDPAERDRIIDEWDAPRHRRPAEGPRLALPRGDPPDRASTPARSGTRSPAAWSRSSSRSTSWAGGGSSSCTTRPRCGSRAGCCSRPA